MSCLVYHTPILYSFHRKLVSRRPVQVDGQPEDVASLVSYLVSKEAHFITGGYIVCCSARYLSDATSSRAMRKLNNSRFSAWLNEGVLNEILT